MLQVRSFIFPAALLLACLSLDAAQVPRKAPEFAVRMTPSGQKLLSNMKGKVTVLVFISTTCPHCQQLTPDLNRIQNEYGSKGVQVLGCAFNDMSNMLVPDFIKTYKPNYPLGWAPREAVLEFLQHSPIMQLYVPILVFVDRNGMIRGQYPGDDAFHQNEAVNIQAKVEELLKGVKSSGRRASGGKK